MLIYVYIIHKCIGICRYLDIHIYEYIAMAAHVLIPPGESSPLLGSVGRLWALLWVLSKGSVSGGEPEDFRLRSMEDEFRGVAGDRFRADIR